MPLGVALVRRVLLKHPLAVQLSEPTLRVCLGHEPAVSHRSIWCVPFRVSAHKDRQHIDEFLTAPVDEFLTQTSEACRLGELLELYPRHRTSPAVVRDICTAEEFTQIRVVNKPHGVPCHLRGNLFQICSYNVLLSMDKRIHAEDKIDRAVSDSGERLTVVDVVFHV